MEMCMVCFPKKTWCCSLQLNEQTTAAGTHADSDRYWNTYDGDNEETTGTFADEDNGYYWNTDIDEDNETTGPQL
ncbi:hypothetical protein AVEN_173302-1 [Araneus ventricosus]|uniref:Uncharacterized protein n=1 Tax=Araneus ventricosus TaxID=182803 RepID=A0A4Y2X3Z2_ARAVE|nr:hypothetical protein AVEN_173302-1 [Araneus ventricosus]